VAIEDGLGIEEAVALALWNNPDFLAALADLDIARADLVQAGLLKNPILSLLLPLGPKQFEAAVNWSVDAMWQRPRRVEDARLNAEAVASQLMAHGLRLVGDVKVAYVDALAAERAARVAADQAALADQMATMVGGRLALGDASDLEARMARVDATRAQAVRTTRAADRDRARLRLYALLGLPPATVPVVLIDPGPVPASVCGASSAPLIAAALAARPDVRAAELHVEGAGERAGLERAKIMALTATLDMNGQGRDGFEAGPGLAVELPILARNQGGRARAAAELVQATRRYEAVRAAVAVEVEAALVSFLEARGLESTLGSDLAASLGRERQQIDRLYDAGEVSLFAVLEMRQRLNDVELSRLEVGLAAARAIARLEAAIGQRCPAN
jgi:cobalt-zinc-cadmium efflux system outer membrane protein